VKIINVASVSRFKHTDPLEAIRKQEYSTAKKPVSALSGKAYCSKEMCRIGQSTMERAAGRFLHRLM